MPSSPERSTSSSFPLRLRNPQVRALLREVAAREHISQNELVEQAVEHELSLRGARLAEDLAAAARRLSRLSDNAYRRLVDESIDAFVAGEAETEPVRAYALQQKRPSTEEAPLPITDPLGVLAAFETSRH